MGFNLKKRWKKQQAGRLKTHLSVLDSAYGEHFEQQPIDTEDGDLYVSFRNSGDNYSIMTRDELDEYIDNQGMTMGEMWYMAVLFSAVTLTADNNQVEFLAAGIPRDTDDLEGWTA